MSKASKRERGDHEEARTHDSLEEALIEKQRASVRGSDRADHVDRGKYQHETREESMQSRGIGTSCRERQSRHCETQRHELPGQIAEARREAEAEHEEPDDGVARHALAAPRI